LQFKSKENKIIIESFSRIYVGISEGYAKAQAWKSTSMVKRYANINAEHLAKKFISKQ